jgi:Enolase C-terminal domain-like
MGAVLGPALRVRAAYFIEAVCFFVPEHRGQHQVPGVNPRGGYQHCVRTSFPHRRGFQLLTKEWIDFIRIHQSSVGGLNMCRKVAHCCEFFDVRTAWHGPNNVDPVGHCYNLHLNLVTPNFGISGRDVF